MGESDPPKDDIKGSGISDEDIKAIREDALKWHNIFRSWHKDTPPMTLNEEVNLRLRAINTIIVDYNFIFNSNIPKQMNKEAQAHAETLIRKGGLRHSKRTHSSDGENLHSMGGNDAKTAGEVASKAWWAEFCDTNKWPRGNLNRFTQLVWKDSVQLGIGVAKGNSRVVVVGRYRTGGNLNGEGKDSSLTLTFGV